MQFTELLDVQLGFVRLYILRSLSSEESMAKIEERLTAILYVLNASGMICSNITVRIMSFGEGSIGG